MSCKACEGNIDDNNIGQIHILFRKYGIGICSPCLLIRLKNDESFYKITEYITTLLFCQGRIDQKLQDADLLKIEEKLVKYKQKLGLQELTRLSEECGGYAELDDEKK